MPGGEDEKENDDYDDGDGNFDVYDDGNYQKAYKCPFKILLFPDVFPYRLCLE